MLITTTEELNRHTQIGEGNSLESYAVDLENAEHDYLKPLLGDTLYANLLTKYGENITTEPDKTLLNLSQAVIASMAVAANLDQRQVHISDQGVQKAGESAYHYQKVEAQNSFMRRGYRAMEQLLLHLEKNVADYPEWKASDAYFQQRSFLIPSATEFQKHYNLKSSRRTYLAMLPIMRRVENFSMRPLLGDTFYEELIKTIQDDSSLTTEQKEANRRLLHDYISPAVAYLTIAASINELSLNLTADGLFLSEEMSVSEKSSATKQASDQQKALLAERSADAADQYLQRLVNYLNAQASDTSFAAYMASDTWQRANPDPEAPRPERTSLDTPPAKKRIYGL